jgi:DNA-binding CsgD family transcriptional regulator
VVGHEYAFYTARTYATAVKAAAEIAERARTLGDDDRAAEAQRDGREILARFRAVLASERWVDGPPTETLAHEALCAAELLRAEGTPAPEAWAAAADRYAALGMPFELAYARWRQAEALVRCGDRASARAALREASALARDLRAELVAAEVEGFARRARIALDDQAPPADDGRDPGLAALGLTERERAVLELVAEGRTNREIGEALFMAEKTASVHVSRILAKLGVRSRVEAATAAHRLGVTAAGAPSAPGDGGRG